ncbi:hypothetical protein D3C84_984780 [compost metagenome]
MFVVQGRQTFAHAVGRVEGQQAASIGDRSGIEQQALAVELHFAHRQVEVVVQQGLQQGGVIEQLA